MRLTGRSILASLLIIMMLGQYICCLSASAVTTKHATSHACCAGHESKSENGKSEPCKHCPQLDASRATIAPTQHVDATPDLALTFANTYAASLAISRQSVVSRFDLKD